PGSAPVISVFNGWPRDWDAEFQLLAAGGFLVTSSQRNGRREFVEVISQAGQECQLKNPWGEIAATLWRDGRQAETLTGSLITFSTRIGETVTVVRTGTTPNQYKAKKGDL
ncbi:MAG TPA: hypothetical protein VFC44_24125, partial [Candidatus Saccharimonadales bacterium]|nr:hypothetical protein [Candidatus Saccharimonadales bacterium]